MRNLNVEVFTNWIATTSDLEALTIIRDKLAVCLKDVPASVLQSVSAAIPGQSGGNFNFRGILHWVDSIGDTFHKNKKPSKTDFELVASVYNLILTRFSMYSVRVEQKVAPAATPTVPVVKPPAAV